MLPVTVAGREIGGGAPAFLIAEIAGAHGGDFEAARELVEQAARAGADAVKFQIYSAAELLVSSHPQYQLFRGLEFTPHEWASLVSLAKARDLIVLADVFGLESFHLAEELAVHGYKIHSSDIPNTPLLRRLAGSGKPLFVACSGSTRGELMRALHILRGAGNHQMVLMHGFQGFPTKPENTNLRALNALQERFQCPVGFADHIDAESPLALSLPLMARAAGAAVIEKHLTLDRSLKGIDYFSSLNPHEFRTLAGLLRDAEKALGEASWEPSPDELLYRKTMKKSLVAARDIPVGTALSEVMLTYKRALTDAHPASLEAMVGKVTLSGLRKEEVVTFSHVSMKAIICVAVRLYSTRLPQKALLPLGGQPILGQLIDRLKLARLPESIVICTTTRPEDVALAALAQEKGVKALRGSELDVMSRFLQAAEQEQAEVVVRVTGDNPLTDPPHLDRLIRFHLENNAEYSVTQGLPLGCAAEAIAVSALHTAHDLAEDPSFSEYMTWYLDNPDFFKVAYLPVSPDYQRPYRLSLDTQEDYQLLSRLFEALYRGTPMPLGVVIAYLDQHPELAAINTHIRPPVTPEMVNTRLRTSF